MTTCINLKHLDLRKITPEMRETNSLGNVSKDDKKGVTPNKAIEDVKDNANVSTDISPDKPLTTSVPNPNTDDISPEGLLEVIS